LLLMHRERETYVMKTQMKPLLSFLILLALLSGPHLASAYYDPGVQRWINRDPAEEGFDLNLYRPDLNRPTHVIDTDGRIPVLIPVVIVVGGGLLGQEEFHCANRIKNQVWDKYGWERDQNGNQVPKPGHHPGDDHFHYGHCVASCRIERECLGGRGTAWATGVAKEIWDQIKHIFGNGPGWEGGDMDANREGRSRGRKCPDKSCEEACGGTEG